MIHLTTIHSGSDGNCHLLTIDGQYLFLDVGIQFMNLKKAINFDMTNLAGCVVTHRHIDHYKSAIDLKHMGYNTFAPCERTDRAERIRTRMGDFEIDAFALTDPYRNHFVHTNANGTECENYAFVIRHPKYKWFNLLYATDCQYIKWKFPKIHNVLLGVDFDTKLLNKDNKQKTDHQIWGHMSIDTACDFVKANNPDANIILTHLSHTSANKDDFVNRMAEVTNTPVYIAKKGFEIQFKKGQIKK